MPQKSHVFSKIADAHLGVRSGGERDPLMTSVEVSVKPAQEGVYVCVDIACKPV